MNEMVKNLLLWMVIAVVLVTVVQSFKVGGSDPATVSYSDFMAQVVNGNVGEVLIHNDNRTIDAKLKDGSKLHTTALLTDKTVDDISKHAKVTVEPTDNSGALWRIVLDWVPFLIFIGLLVYFMRQMQAGAGGRGAMSFGRSRARLQGEDQVKITFADVAGVDEAKDEVQE
ncbi:MAG: ATP-dependent metallopeptidase FtsH/Yme1/Tma family protein, partial [Rudaea sp.]